VLADEVLMLLPGGLVINDRDAALEAMSGAPWETFELTDERVLDLTPTSAVVAYRATASRTGTEYEALVSSTYVRGDFGWRLTVHQQSPA
jgi:hypothetical protein